jgi:hypothetical protein
MSCYQWNVLSVERVMVVMIVVVDGEVVVLSVVDLSVVAK